MKQTDLIGKVQTVTGIIDPSALGVTLPHEHLLTDLSVYFTEPDEASRRKMAHEPVRLDNRYWVVSNCLSHSDDLKLTDEQVAIKEALMFRRAGGDTIVEVSNIGLARDPFGLARISRATGLNIVMGASFYIGISHPPEVSTKTDQELAEQIVQDILVGVANTPIRAGIIGEVGCTLPLNDNERKVLRASAMAQQRTGAALSIHPSGKDELLLEIVEILSEAGADLTRTIISHVDCWGFSHQALCKVAERGCFVEHDTFGSVGVFPPHEGRYLDWPSDAQRVNSVIRLIAEGYLKNVLMSQDICFKHLLTSYGGYGYAHLLRDIVPIMRSKGVSEEQIHAILVENPKRVLPFVPARK